MASDPDLLEAARRQLAACQGDVYAFLGWWVAWEAQDGVDRDDLVDLVRSSPLAGLGAMVLGT
jgi:hypothetical protein